MSGRRPLPFSVRFSKPHAAIQRIGAALHEARRLHPVDVPGDGDRLHVEEPGELRLVDALVLRDAAEDLELRRSHVEMSHFLIEAPAQEARGPFDHEEPERTRLGGVHKPAILIIRGRRGFFIF